jgi:hypothetical protein
VTVHDSECDREGAKENAKNTNSSFVLFVDHSSGRLPMEFRIFIHEGHEEHEEETEEEANPRMHTNEHE